MNLLLLLAPGVHNGPGYVELPAMIHKLTHGRVTAYWGPADLTREEVLACERTLAERGVFINAVALLHGALPKLVLPQVRHWFPSSIVVSSFGGAPAVAAYSIGLWLAPSTRGPSTAAAAPQVVAQAACPEPEWLAPEAEALVESLVSTLRVHEPWLTRLVVVRDQTSGEFSVRVDRVPEYARFHGKHALPNEVGFATAEPSIKPRRA